MVPVEKQIKRLRYLKQKINNDAELMALTGPAIISVVSSVLDEAADTIETLNSGRNSHENRTV